MQQGFDDYKQGKQRYFDYGLGNMTKEEYRDLYDRGFIAKMEDGQFGVASIPCGIVEYRNRGSEQDKVRTFHGKNIELILFQVEEFKASLNESRARITRDEVIAVPAFYICDEDTRHAQGERCCCEFVENKTI